MAHWKVASVPAKLQLNCFDELNELFADVVMILAWFILYGRLQNDTLGLKARTGLTQTLIH